MADTIVRSRREKIRKMKKIAFILLCIAMLCTAAVFAEESDTAGGTITLTQFLGVSREEAKSVAITITMYDTDFETAYVDKDAFYDISDDFMLVPILDPEPLTWEGIYITVEKANGDFSYAYIEQWGFADSCGTLMSGVPYGLYKEDDYRKTLELVALGKPKITVDEKLNITINGRRADFTLSPFIDENNRTLVSAKEFCGLIHKSCLQVENPLHIAINPHSDTALESGGNLGDSVIFKVGEKNYEINGRLHETDTAAQLVDGNIYVPLRALAELLGYNVMYIPALS